mgnify:CR=1 FL=1
MNKKKMNAVVTLGTGGYEQLSYKEVDLPKISSGEVLIKVFAAGVNNTEINTRLGWYSSSFKTSTNETQAHQESKRKDIDDGGWNENVDAGNSDHAWTGAGGAGFDGYSAYNGGNDGDWYGGDWGEWDQSWNDGGDWGDQSWQQEEQDQKKKALMAIMLMKKMQLMGSGKGGKGGEKGKGSFESDFDDRK